MASHLVKGGQERTTSPRARLAPRGCAARRSARGQGGAPPTRGSGRNPQRWVRRAGVGWESPGAETEAAGSPLPAQLERFPRGLAPVASRLSEAASQPPEPLRVLRAGLRAAERAGTGRGAEGSGARMQVRPAAPRPGSAAGRRSPRGLSSPSPAAAARAPHSPREGAPRAGLGWPGASHLLSRPQVMRRRFNFHT